MSYAAPLPHLYEHQAPQGTQEQKQSLYDDPGDAIKLTLTAYN